VDSGYEYPKAVIPIVSIKSDGSLLSIDGSKIDDKLLRQLLRRTRTVDKKEMCLLRLQSSTEKEVSMHTLGTVLQRVRSLADPKIPTVVYIYLRELPSEDEKKKEK